MAFNNGQVAFVCLLVDACIYSIEKQWNNEMSLSDISWYTDGFKNTTANTKCRLQINYKTHNINWKAVKVPSVGISTSKQLLEVWVFMLELSFRKSINVLSGFLSSTAGMHSWNIIFTLNLTSYQTRTHLHFKLSNLGWKKWGREKSPAPICIFISKYDVFCPGLVSFISACCQMPKPTVN